MMLGMYGLIILHKLVHMHASLQFVEINLEAMLSNSKLAFLMLLHQLARVYASLCQLKLCRKTVRNISQHKGPLRKLLLAGISH
jgi:hypothetical protein